MTYITFLAGSLLFIVLASAAPAAQEQPLDQPSSQSLCTTGTTICVNLYNGCEGKTEGCYDACNSAAYTPQSCVPTSLTSTTLIATQDTVIIPTVSTVAPVNTALFAEQIVSPIIDPISSSSSILAFLTPISPSPPPSTIKPTITTLEGDNVPLALGVVDIEAPIKASITTAAVLAQNNGNNVTCGVKTECWDAVTSLGKDCPRVRYGGCYDVCRGDPKTIFTPRPCIPRV